MKDKELMELWMRCQNRNDYDALTRFNMLEEKDINKIFDLVAYGKFDKFVKSKPLEIYMDDRENNVMFSELGEVGITCRIKRMDVGDYVWEEGGVCIERKTINDFCTSILDGRMESQAKRMKEKYLNNYFLICGRINDRVGPIHENAVVGAMVSLLLKYKVNVLCVDNEHQLAYAMKRIFERHRDNKSKLYNL